MKCRQRLICFFLPILVALSAKALPNPSPAGGRMLQLDATHDFLGTGQAWFADEQFKQLTVEAWIYFEEPPEHGTFWSIIGQGGRFNFVIHGNSGGSEGVVWIRQENAKGASLSTSIHPLPTRRWLHIVLLYNGVRVSMSINGDHGLPCCGNGHLVKSDNLPIATHKAKSRKSYNPANPDSDKYPILKWS